MASTVFKSDALKDQVAVVTGAAGGIGGAICRALGDAGATVVPTDIHRDDWHSTTMAPKIELDVSLPLAIGPCFDKIISIYGRVDVLVNAAGIAVRTPSLDESVEEWDRVMNINLRGTFLCCQAAARDMAKRHRGAIVNISSELGIAPQTLRAAYVASKAGVNGLTALLALEWAPLGVRVNAVAPGGTRTPMMAAIEANSLERDFYLAKVADGRFAEPAEIADAVLFLASAAAQHVIGHVLVVDGGYTVG